MLNYSKHPQDVGKMFDRVAKGYDRTNALLSLGQDRRWRRQACKALGVGIGDWVLDLGAGTGRSSLQIAKTGAEVIGVDISDKMLEVARKRCRKFHNLNWQLVDGIGPLPFEQDRFDGVLTAFCLRNMPNTLESLRDIRRVLRPGGRLVICEFSHPQGLIAAWQYRLYVQGLLPKLARITGSDPAAYEYLTESIDQWYDQAQLADLLVEAGFEAVSWRSLNGGLVALHMAVGA